MGKRSAPLHRGPLIMSAALVALAACSAPQEQGGLSAMDELLLASAKVALPPAGVTPATLPDPDSHGAQLVSQYCAGCHNLPSPSAHAANDWPGVADACGFVPGTSIPS